MGLHNMLRNMIRNLDRPYRRMLRIMLCNERVRRSTITTSSRPSCVSPTVRDPGVGGRWRALRRRVQERAAGSCSSALRMTALSPVHNLATPAGRTLCESKPSSPTRPNHRSRLLLPTPRWTASRCWWSRFRGARALLAQAAVSTSVARSVQTANLVLQPVIVMLTDGDRRSGLVGCNG